MVENDEMKTNPEIFSPTTKGGKSTWGEIPYRLLSSMQEGGVPAGTSATAFGGHVSAGASCPIFACTIEKRGDRCVLDRDKSITHRRKIIDFIMAQGAGHGEATVGSDGPRQKGKATPDTIK